MGALTISLEDGFARDHVVVAVNDAVVFDDVQVSTRYQISLAREITVPVPAGRCRVRVRLPERGLESTLDLDTGQTSDESGPRGSELAPPPGPDAALRVSVDQGRLRMRAADQPRHA